MMRDVDRWVLSNTFRAFAHRSAGDTVVAVNLSAQSLCDDDFLGFVLAEIDVTGIDSAMLCFEVTETAAMSNLSRAQEVIRALKARHCTFSLDDFGSGLSSFGYLKNLPVDYLKIDGSFVHVLTEDPVAETLVDAFNRIGHAMGLETVAEYVDNEATRERLAALGVDYAQGHGVGFARDIDSLLEDAAEPALG
jgi:EAL domain-containing protein (putative c-di-GMP-specific phosphodiesterase class I)